MNRCPSCASELQATPWGELCGSCALGLGSGPARRRVGDYECLQPIGEGSMGAVYLAKHVGSGELVALKVAKPSLLELPGGAALFRQQARIESALRHPNIVHVQGAGMHESIPYLVMPFMEGGTLADIANAERYREPRARLQLVLKLARAVHFAHERGVLHCDLKPLNILFDGAGEPQVSDFGLARQLGASGVAEPAGVRGGTLGWMSPEQLRDAALTTTSDIFALGVLLFWLDTGKLPFGDGSQLEPLPPLRCWSPELAWGLQAVTHRALQLDPERRYLSAAALAADLEQLQAGQPPRARRVPWWGRAWYWTERHRGMRTASLVLLPAFALLALDMASRQRSELRTAVLDMNAYAASGQAAAVLYQLREHAEAIERAAADPTVVDLVRGPLRVPRSNEPNPCSVQQQLEDPRPLVSYAGTFSTIFVLDDDACPRARISDEPALPDYVRTSFAWRDYFAGAKQDPLGGGKVRKAYSSYISKTTKFAVSAPLLTEGRFSGVVAGSILVASTLALPRMKRNESGDQHTVLLGPFETDPDREGVPRDAHEYTYLMHSSLPPGKKQALDPAIGKLLARAFPAGQKQFELGSAQPLKRDDYRDPLLGGHWLAAFAPVGATGYVVLLQTRQSVALRPSDGLWHAAIVLALGSTALLVLWGFFRAWRWQRERHR